MREGRAAAALAPPRRARLRLDLSFEASREAHGAVRGLQADILRLAWSARLRRGLRPRRSSLRLPTVRRRAGTRAGRLRRRHIAFTIWPPLPVWIRYSPASFALPRPTDPSRAASPFSPPYHRIHTEPPAQARGKEEAAHHVQYARPVAPACRPRKLNADRRSHAKLSASAILDPRPGAARAPPDANGAR